MRWIPIRRSRNLFVRKSIRPFWLGDWKEGLASCRVDSIMGNRGSDSQEEWAPVLDSPVEHFQGVSGRNVDSMLSGMGLPWPVVLRPERVQIVVDAGLQ